MNNYSKAKVFKIESASTGLVYYGSTCDTLDDCLAELMNHHIAYHKGSMKYSTSFEVLWERDAVMTLVESCPCSNKQQLHAVRDKHIRANRCVNMPNRCKSGPNQLFPSYRIKYDKDPGDYENRLCELFGIDVECECGASVFRDSLPRHKKSTNHLRQLATLK